jgi:hypothetical protein
MAPKLTRLLARLAKNIGTLAYKLYGFFGVTAAF